MPWSKSQKQGEKSGFDSGVFHIEDVRFEHDDLGRCVGYFEGTFITAEGQEFPGSDERYSLGKSFEPTDGGKAAIHETGDEEKGAHAKAGFTDLINRALEVFPEIEERGHPFHRDTWVGLSFEGERELRDTFTDKDTGETVEVTRYLPQRIWVRDEEGKASTPSESSGNGEVEGDKADVIASLVKEVKEADEDFVTLIQKASKKGIDPADPELEKAWG